MAPNPEQIKLSDQERDELVERVESNRLSDGDRQLLVKLIRCFFWVTFSLRETKISLNHLKKALFGGSGVRRGGHQGNTDSDDSDDPGSGDSPPPSHEKPSTEALSDDPSPPPEKPPRPGHGRRGADDYPGAKTVMCCHGHLNAGERCPAVWTGPSG